MATPKVGIITPARPEEWLRELVDALRDCVPYEQWQKQPYTVDSIRCIGRAVLMPAVFQLDLIDMFSDGVKIEPLSLS